MARKAKAPTAVKANKDPSSHPMSRAHIPNSQANLIPFKPGQSGNPKGVPKSTLAMKKTFATHTELAEKIIVRRAELEAHAIDLAIDVANNVAGAKERLDTVMGALRAIPLETAREILDRAHGRAQQNVAVNSGDVLEGMTREELEEFILNATPEVLALIRGRKKPAQG